MGDIWECLGHPPTLAFTATAGKQMQTRIQQSLGVPVAKVFVADVDHPNIGLIREHFCPGCHRLRAEAYRRERAQRFQVWNEGVTLQLAV